MHLLECEKKLVEREKKLVEREKNPCYSPLIIPSINLAENSLFKFSSFLSINDYTNKRYKLGQH